MFTKRIKLGDEDFNLITKLIRYFQMKKVYSAKYKNHNLS